MILQIADNQDFENRVLKGQGRIFALFTADWCPYCKTHNPRVNALEQTLGFTLAIVDVDACLGIDEKYQVMSIPSLLIFEGGSLIDRNMVDNLNKEELVSWVRENMK